MNLQPNEQQALQEEIARLEQKLHDAKQKLGPQGNGYKQNGLPSIETHPTADVLATSSLHTLLLLSDSALPLGSFAFSSGLESYLAHEKGKYIPNGAPRDGPAPSQYTLLQRFLDLSLQSLASTALPYVLAAHRDPMRLEGLDNDFDASTPCTVARRASVAQGRALLSVWEKSFRNHYPSPSGTDQETGAGTAITTLQSFSALLRSNNTSPYPPSAHLGPLWGIITNILSIPLHSSAYLFLFSHARTVVSAAVRASVLGPYQAQGVLASVELRDTVEALVGRYWNTETTDAGQSVPVLDLWVGRHEMLYSRIFNS